SPKRPCPRSRRPKSRSSAGRGPSDLLQKLLVGRELLHCLPQLDDRLLGRNSQRAAPELVDRLDLVLGIEKLVATRPALRDVQGGEDALVGQGAVEDDLAVSGSLELLEDHVV